MVRVFRTWPTTRRTWDTADDAVPALRNSTRISATRVASFLVALRATLAGEVVTDDETVELVIANPFCVTESHKAY